MDGNRVYVDNIDSLKSAIQLLVEDNGHNYWYRGQANASRPIVSSVNREVDGLWFDEGNLFWDFKLNYYGDRSQLHDNFCWLSLMQHHGLPTRLIDWTENPLIALYFAVEKHFDKDSVLFKLSPSKLNHASLKLPFLFPPDGVFSKVYSELVLLDKWDHFQSVIGHMAESHQLFPDYVDLAIELVKNKKGYDCPIAITPYKLFDRMRMQQSVFTMDGGKIRFDLMADPLPQPIFLEDLNVKNDPFLFAYKIPAESKERIKDDLKKVSVHESVLFPEPEYQARVIKNQHRMKMN